MSFLGELTSVFGLMLCDALQAGGRQATAKKSFFKLQKKTNHGLSKMADVCFTIILG